MDKQLYYKHVVEYEDGRIVGYFATDKDRYNPPHEEVYLSLDEIEAMLHRKTTEFYKAFVVALRFSDK